jgi:hypothetical protein
VRLSRINEQPERSVLHLDKFYKGRSQEKHISSGWNFSCFSAHLIERDLF